MGRAACPLHDTGNHGWFERRSNRQAARRGRLRLPAKQAGARDIAVALTPRDGTRSRVDVPRNAARPLRYLNRFVTVTQGEVFYVTEALAQLEGMERGPAGNTS